MTGPVDDGATGDARKAPADRPASAPGAPSAVPAGTPTPDKHVDASAVESDAVVHAEVEQAQQGQAPAAPERGGRGGLEVVDVRRGMFNNYAIVQGVDHIVPVDIYLPGCPPRPEMLINAILALHDQIQTEPLGANRREAALAAEAAALAATPTSHQKGLLR